MTQWAMAVGERNHDYAQFMFIRRNDQTIELGHQSDTGKFVYKSEFDELMVPFMNYCNAGDEGQAINYLRLWLETYGYNAPAWLTAPSRKD